VSTSPAVSVDNLRKEFIRRDGKGRRRGRRRRVAALHDITFTMRRGECVAILGQNGSGKSTLVRLLSTLLIGDGGTAEVFGIDVSKRPRSVQRLVNRVSVEASFFKRMSPRENLSYSARFYGMMPGETRRRIPEILRMVGFPEDRSGEPASVPAGERRCQQCRCTRPNGRLWRRGAIAGRGNRRAIGRASIGRR